MNLIQKKLGRKSILDLTHDEARKFFLKPESYCNLDFPSYIDFSSIIDKVDNELSKLALSSVKSKNIRDCDGVNYTLLHNKDGRYAWRPFQLIHPALYVSLVHEITNPKNWRFIQKRFNDFAGDDKIHCLSLPVVSSSNQKDRAEQVSQWWEEVEQRSIAFSLEYDYVLETDITDCYGAIYTHTIAWALHDKEEAKKKRRSNNLIGNIIDSHIQDMRNGQTNGIPQGSVLMDFIAEMVLGFSDLWLSTWLKHKNISNFQILRYRDDYRVFVNNPQEGDAIAKTIAEILITLGLKLNPSKTHISSDVVRASIKKDKLAWIGRKQREKDTQKHLLIIHDHSLSFPNSGSLTRALNDYYKHLVKEKLSHDRLMPLIAIATDIAYRNPRTYPISAAILSILLGNFENDEEKYYAVQHIQEKFKKLPNTGHMQIWLQRATLSISRDIRYTEAICKLAAGENTPLWNNDWISSRKLKNIITPIKIIDKSIRDKLAPAIQLKEIELFLSNSEGYYV